MSAAVWQKGLPHDNYEVSLEGKRLEGLDFFCGMTFPVGKSYCTLIVGGWGGYIVGLSNVDKCHAGENDTTQSIDLKSNKWYSIRVRVTDLKIEVWLDNKKVISQERKGHTFSIWPQQEICRPFGISTWRTKSALKNIKIKRLSPQQTGLGR